ncbi:MAG: LuxR C-terminal-related transcriptional regulator [Chloroflexota bacterium]
MLQSLPPSPIELLLTTLLNEISALSDAFVLVLDDYHVLDAKVVDDALIFLLEHVPPQMHILIMTREDPPFPLARYRARGELTELRAANLRFTPAEAANFLNQMMNLNLSAQEIATLESHTEGWIAGLQMAGLALQGHLARQETHSIQELTALTQNNTGQLDTGQRYINGFIQAFTGSHRFILDYLAEEVLQQQPEPIRRFLLQTSILNSLCGPLCDAVIDVEQGQDDGRKMLMSLERSNLFLVALDERREWYRYHRLFADVLQVHALASYPDQLPILHQRASIWYEQKNLLSDAIRHAFAAEDFERAANLIEVAQGVTQTRFPFVTRLDWLKALPEELVRVRPVLSVGYAWALLSSNELEAGKARLQNAQRWLDIAADRMAQAEMAKADISDTANGDLTDASLTDTRLTDARPADAKIAVVDEAQFRSLPAAAASARAYIAQALGNVPDAVAKAQRALGLLSTDDDAERALPTMILAMAHWASGNLEAASLSFADFMTTMQTAGQIPVVVGCTSFLAQIRVAQGHLQQAIRIYERSLTLATKQGGSVFPGMVDLHVGLSELLYERGEGETAAHHLRRSEELGEQAIISGNEYNLYPVMARIKVNQGNLDGALELLDAAEQLYYKTPIPIVRPFAAQKAQIWLAQGRLTEALDWVHKRGLSIDDNLSYLQEFEHMILARVLIAQEQGSQDQSHQHQRNLILDSRGSNDEGAGTIQQALGLLNRLQQAAEEEGRQGSLIEILILQALAHTVHQSTPSALLSLKRALTLAEPEGYVRIFVNEGPPMALLLQKIAADAIMAKEVVPNYVRHLQAAFDKSEVEGPATQSLPDALSQRELELLTLVADGLTNQQISDRLFISIATTKKHMSNILSKLSAGNRTEAVRRAQDLQLL